MATPIDFLIENQSIILKTYTSHGAVTKDTWVALQETLPKLSQAMKYNTFKQYFPVVIAFRDKIQNQYLIELSKLEQLLTEKDKLIKAKEMELTALKLNYTVLEEKLSKLEQRSKNIDGWTVRLTSKGYYNLCKSFGGKVESIYLGKVLDKNLAKKKITERMSMLNEKEKTQ